MSAKTERYLTPPAVAEKLGVDADTVRGWINAGELHAIDVAQRGCRRRRWRIAPSDLAAFERSRSAIPDQRVHAEPRRKRGPGKTIAFF
jgi:excisionase family DNA binding protein